MSSIVKIRLRGTREQLEKLCQDLEFDENVLNISEFCPDDRKTRFSRYGRVYIDYRVDVDD